MGGLLYRMKAEFAPPPHRFFGAGKYFKLIYNHVSKVKSIVFVKKNQFVPICMVNLDEDKK
jgi:hypothetical protein